MLLATSAAQAAPQSPASVRSSLAPRLQPAQARLLAPQTRPGAGSATAAAALHRQQCRQCARQRRAVTAMAGSDAGQGGKTKVLFVCLGNICRSPSAEAVFRSVVERAGVADRFEIDSCGTGGGSSNWYLPGGFSYHEGDPADSRMAATARARGVTLTSRSRPLTPQDLSEFDYIIGMDDANLAAIRRAAEHWRGAGGAAVPPGYAAKLANMTDFLRDTRWQRYSEVPDPYYGGAQGFELVLDLLDDACGGLLDAVQGGKAGR